MDKLSDYRPLRKPETRERERKLGQKTFRILCNGGVMTDTELGHRILPSEWNGRLSPGFVCEAGRNFRKVLNAVHRLYWRDRRAGNDEWSFVFAHIGRDLGIDKIDEVAVAVVEEEHDRWML